MQTSDLKRRAGSRPEDMGDGLMGHIAFARFVGWLYGDIRVSTLSPPLFEICVQIDGPYIHIHLPVGIS